MMTSSASTESVNLPPPSDLLARLVCPVTHAPLRYDQETNELISDKAGLAFPVKDGILVMLPQEARPLQAEETR